MPRFILQIAPLSLLLIFGFNKAFSQFNYSLLEKKTEKEAIVWLSQPQDDAFTSNPEKMELMIDLFKASVEDSIVKKKKQDFEGFVGWFARRILRRFWVRLDPDKKTLVGTVAKDFKIFHGFAKEMDFNIFLIPHSEKYISMVQDGFERSKRPLRNKKKYKFATPEYSCPSELFVEDCGYLTIECEGTPSEKYRDQINDFWFPTEPGYYSLDTFGTFGTKYPTIGLSGVWCLDCNHNCRPEIHPIEWIWWQDIRDKEELAKGNKTWMVSFMRDVSKRFDDWSPAPRKGVMKFPFAFSDKVNDFRIEAECMLYDPVPAAPAAESDGIREAGEYAFNCPNMKNAPAISFKLSGETSNHVIYSLKELNHDQEKGIYYGYLEIDVTTNDLFILRVKTAVK